jgi:aminopeptidase N
MSTTRSVLRLCVVAVCTLLASSSRAQFTSWDGPEQPRTHTTDIRHIEMHIAFDEPAKKVIGSVLHTLTVLPQREPVTSITFDAMDMTIGRAWLQDKSGKRTMLSFDTSEANKVHINLPKPAVFNEPMTIGLDYTGLPKRGMYFIEPDTFYTTRPQQIWTQGEGEDNRHWLPTYDYPNDKTTTEMYVTVRADQQALSNGHLVDKKKNKDGTVTWHWKEDSPYSTYLIMLGVGKYEVPTDKWRGKDVQYWVYPGWEKEAHRIFGLTPDMLEFFSSRTGFEYAWEKYAQIAIADFMYGGMENVSATTLNDYVLYDKRSGIDFSSEGLIAHELAHQWFGDVLTCRSWIHMWLNESFATYFEGLYREYHDGKDEFDEEMYGAQMSGINTEIYKGKRPIVATNAYTENTYPRGAATLNMIRHILGDSGWWNSINHYLHKHAYQPVVTEDLKIAFQEATGQNLTWFFDEWIYKSGHPVFDVSYDYDQAAKLVRLHVAQTQKQDSLTGIFKMPVDVELWMPDGTTRMETIHVSDSAQTFTLVAPEKPQVVIFDKGNTIIKELHFTKPAEEWLYQLGHAKLAIERSQAARALVPTNFAGASASSSNAIWDGLVRTATTDSFWSTRLHALHSLAQWSDSSDRIGPTLMQILHNEKRSDIRAAAVAIIADHMDRPAASAILNEMIVRDSSYSVVGAALRALAKSDSLAAFPVALQFLATSSPRDRMRQAAIDVIESNNSVAALNELIRLVGEHNIPKWTRWNIINAIGSKVNVDSARVYNVLWAITKNGEQSIRNTAYNKLADIGGQDTYERIRREAALYPDQKETFDGWLERMRKRLGISAQ